MREMIYVSDQKLRQFVVSQPRRSWWQSIKIEGEIGIPLLGKLKLAKGDPLGLEGEIANLEDVVRAIDDFGRTPEWFDNPAAESGDWVYFEAKMRWTVLGDHPGTVLFVADEAAASSDGEMVFLLHGSAEHLMAKLPSSRPWALWATLHRFYFAGLPWTGSAPADPSDLYLDPLEWLYLAKKRQRWTTPARVSGYARITSNEPVRNLPTKWMRKKVRRHARARLIAGTPLYVEYERELPS